ncbi:MAG: hypothetical protein WDW38_010651 [Sanguina aurantia]
MNLGAGIRADVHARLNCYSNDWSQGWESGSRILAPASYIFLASLLPALAFGQQLTDETGHTITVVQVLVSTALGGIIQAVVGGQPLLIVGVSEPIVITYGFMYTFARGQPGLGSPLFLAWAAWVCVWTSVSLFALALLNTCSLIRSFTPFSGEIFGMLTSMLFAQQAVKGVIADFSPLPGSASGAAPSPGPQPWLVVNGLWSLLLACGMLMTSMFVETAGSWRFGVGVLRSLLALYGVPIMVVAWSGLSFALKGAPEGIPSRVRTPNTWEPSSNWSTITRMADVPPAYIAGALVPALIITILFYFDHNVSALMAQPKSYRLAKPPAYHYDLLLLSLVTLACAALAKLKHQLRATAAKQATADAALPAAVVTRPQGCSTEGPGRAVAVLAAVSTESGCDPWAGQTCPACDAAAGSRTSGTGAGGVEGVSAAGRSHSGHSGHMVCGVEGPGPGPDPDPGKESLVVEQRLSGLMQAAGVLVALGATPAIKQIPTGVIWGYFAYMSIAFLTGSEFWERLQLLITDPRRRAPSQGGQPRYLRAVPMRTAFAFTLFQLACLLGVWALVTFAGIGGIAFPVLIFLLLPVRQYLMPLLFHKPHLSILDEAEYDVVSGCSFVRSGLGEAGG